MHIGEVLHTAFDERVGWRAASGSIKPVHVANGLVRSLTGQCYDTSHVNELIVWWKQGKRPDDARATASMLTGQNARAFACFVDHQRDLDRLRRYANGLLAADGAVYPSAEHSSLTLACAEMVSADHNDHGLGDFAATLLEGPDGTGPLANCVLDALHSAWPSDPVATIVWPLLDTSGKEWRRPRKGKKALSSPHNRAFREQMHLAATDLASHERSQGNRLRTLQRAVQFACAATHAHAQALGAGGILADRTPALLTASGPKGSPVARASERSLERVYMRFERWLGDQLAQLIHAGRPLAPGAEALVADSLDGRKIRGVLSSIGLPKLPHGSPDKETLDERMTDFERFRKELDGSDPASILGHTLVTAHVREYISGGPRVFLQGLARKIGLLYPPYQGRSREKRVRPSVPVLDMLVRACVPAGEMISLTLFLERLWERFGFIVGGRRVASWDDSVFLRKQGLAVDIANLAENSDAFVGQLLLMGLARTHADNVTFIGDPHA